jgi:hypothetical protein
MCQIVGRNDLLVTSQVIELMTIFSPGTIKCILYTISVDLDFKSEVKCTSVIHYMIKSIAKHLIPK